MCAPLGFPAAGAGVCRVRYETVVRNVAALGCPVLLLLEGAMKLEGSSRLTCGGVLHLCALLPLPLELRAGRGVSPVVPAQRGAAGQGLGCWALTAPGSWS